MLELTANVVIALKRILKELGKDSAQGFLSMFDCGAKFILWHRKNKAKLSKIEERELLTLHTLLFRIPLLTKCILCHSQPCVRNFCVV